MKRLFEFGYQPDQTIKHWVILRDSLESVREGRRRHDRLAVPLRPSSYHLDLLNRGEQKSVQVVKDRDRKWWVLFKVKLEPEPIEMDGKPKAVLSIDLGIKKAACSVVLTGKGLKHVHYWKQKKKADQMERYDSMVASLQQKKENLLRTGKNADGVIKRLHALGSKRVNLSLDYDGKLIRNLSDHIIDLSATYDLHVGIGRLKGIRNKARRGNGKGRDFRRMVNRWSFARITDSLKHKLSMDGFDPKRVRAVPEYWTSVTCSKCGHRGLRPKQSFFLCHTCGYRVNADMNAAINIGRRLIKIIPTLRDDMGLGQWTYTPKTRRSTSSKEGPRLSKRPPALSVGENAADCHAQTSLEMYVGSTDPAVEKTMEDSSAAVDSGGHSSTVQRTEAQFRERSNALMKSDKAREHPVGEVPLVAGDGSRGKG